MNTKIFFILMIVCSIFVSSCSSEETQEIQQKCGIQDLNENDTSLFMSSLNKSMRSVMDIPIVVSQTETRTVNQQLELEDARYVYVDIAFNRSVCRLR